MVKRNVYIYLGVLQKIIPCDNVNISIVNIAFQNGE